VISMDHLRRRVLRAGLDDWIPLQAIDGMMRQLGVPAGAEAKVMGLALIYDLARERLVEIGDVTDRGFVPWEVPVELAIQRIAEEWQDSDGDRWAFFCWLSNTEQGDREAFNGPAKDDPCY